MCRSSTRGFTLIEVLAALLIAAVALTYLIQSETGSVRLSNYTRDLRTATMLAHVKLQELIAGIETDSSGDFEEPEHWSWDAAREPFTEGFDTERVIVTVHYSCAGKPQTVSLEQIAP